MYDTPNTVEKLKHPTAEKVEAIKDALKYLGIIMEENSNFDLYNEQQEWYYGGN